MQENSLFNDKVFKPAEENTGPQKIKEYGCNNGVYLETVELQNWGPFSGISEIPLGGYPALFVGENGTGKSSLMDAILTLLISSGLRYNSASDNHSNRSDERTLAEYILGIAGSNLSEDSDGVKKTMKYLRKTGEISIVLLRFRTGTDFLTLANVFLIEEGRKEPQRFYVFAKRPLSIRADFSVSCSNFDVYRNTIGRMKDVTTTTDKSKYFQFVRNEVGLINDNAMRLVRSLSSMKSLPKPDEFIRSHMLPGRTDYKSAFREMKQGMEVVNEIGQRLSDERKRFSMLDAMATVLLKALALQKEKDVWKNIGEKVRPFVYKQGKDTALQEIGAFQEKKAVLDKKIAQLDHKKTECISLKATLLAERDKKGGTAIIQKKAELSVLSDEKARKEKILSQFSDAVRPFGFNETITTEHVFKEILKKIAKRKKEVSQLFQSRITVRDEKEKASLAAGNQYRQLESQRVRLEKDKISVDAKIVAIRDEICRTLGVKPEIMPFLGDFLSVKEKDKEWRPVLEHLLYHQSISFLVPEELLLKVSDYVRSLKTTGIDISYIGMKSIVPNKIPDRKDAPHAWEKITVSPNRLYSDWVKEYIRSVAGNYCCNTSEVYNDCYPALMKDGQMHTSRHMYRKRGKIDIFDPQNFVMNGSFEEKKKAIEKMVKEAEVAFEEAKREYARAAVAVRELEKEKDMLDNIPFVSDFSEIDVGTVENAIEDCRSSIAVLSADAKLEAVEDRIRKTDEKIVSIEEAISTVKTEEEEIVSKLGFLTVQSKTYQDLLDAVLFTPEEEEILMGLYAKYKPDSANPKFESILNVAPKISSFITRKLGEISEESNRQNREAESRMRAYLDEFKSRRADLVADISIPGEAEKFIAERDAVKDVSLPDAIAQFEEIRTFGKLDPLRHFVTIMTIGVEQEIRKTVDDINKTLRKVPYSQGAEPTFLQVNCLQNREGDIVQLRQMLNELVRSGVLSALNTVSSEEAEKISLKARELIDFLEPRTLRIHKDTYSQANILDPRNWFMFPVSVCREVVSEDGQIEIVHVKELDKANKQSSGEGEKFTYFILAVCFAMWMHLLDENYTGHTLRFLMIDEIGNKLTSSNLRDVVALFGILGIQLISILPHGDKISEYEGYVENIVQTDWLDKTAGVSFVDTLSLVDYVRRNKENMERLLETGRKNQKVMTGSILD